MYPNTEQQTKLAVQFGCARWVWNQALAQKQAAYRDRGESLSCFTIKKTLPVLKEQNPWLREADSQALQSSILHLDEAYKRFFQKKAGFPRFKKKAGRQSIQYPQRVKIVDRNIYLPKVGWVSLVLHREYTGIIKTVTVSKEPSGKYYASVLTEDGQPQATPVQNIETVTGIDVGLLDLVVTSNGYRSGNPRFLKRASANIRRKQKSLSRKKKGSKNRAKARILVAKAQERVRFQRNDFQHKLSKQLADENQAVIAESLKVQNMMKNRKLAKSISCAGWGGLLVKTSYKVKRKGGHFVRIDQFFASSKRCSCCGAKRETLDLSVRIWTCLNCGMVHDRDDNASQNIKQEGIKQLQAAGWTVSAHGGLRKTGEIPAAACEAGSLCLQA